MGESEPSHRPIRRNRRSRRWTQMLDRVIHKVEGPLRVPLAQSVAPPGLARICSFVPGPYAPGCDLSPLRGFPF